MELTRGEGEFDQCPHCGSDQRDGDYRRTVMVEIRGVYDGGLFYECPDCRGRWHRWPKGHWLRLGAVPYVEGGRYR